MRWLKLIVFFIWLPAIALNEGLAPIELVKQSVDRYKSVATVSADIKKTVHLELLGETKKSTGTFLFSKGRLRVEILSPEPFLVVMNKNTVWVITPTDKSLGGKTQVMKIKADKNSKVVKSPIAALLSDAKAWDNFKVTKQTPLENSKQIELVPKAKAVSPELARIIIDIQLRDHRILKLEYFDDLGNSTKYEFENIDFKAKANDSKFDYRPPTDAEITEY